MKSQMEATQNRRVWYKLTRILKTTMMSPLLQPCNFQPLARMRIAARLQANLWPEIDRAAGYIANRTPNKQLNWKTPFEALIGSKPKVTHLHVFGCRAYPLRYKIPNWFSNGSFSKERVDIQVHQVTVITGNTDWVSER